MVYRVRIMPGVWVGWKDGYGCEHLGRRRDARVWYNKRLAKKEAREWPTGEVRAALK